MIKKILIANRGEIALRIQRTANKLGITTVAVYADADRNAAFVKQAAEAVLLDGNQLSETYLNIDKIIAIAKQTGSDAIHPGYGFLSENAGFVKACNEAGIIFIGPAAEAMQAVGNKIAARENAVKVGVPVIPGLTGNTAALMMNYKTVGFPMLIKAAAGGGGKGMRVVNKKEELQNALESAAREAKNYFGDDTVYIERYIEKPRHIEVQVLGDQHGNIIHLFERECSLQRRHQKIIEEAPTPTLPQNVREKICAAGVQLAQSIGYYSAGTLEFLADEDLSFYFLEMNTRIQVEHPVTELTTGIDIVEQQIKIANGEPLAFEQKDIRQKGHAIECRIYAEDPEQHFLPSPGLIKYYQEPVIQKSQVLSEIPSSITTIRIDGMQLETGDIISGDFDPMIGKLIVWAHDRESARLEMLAALQQYHIKGIKTNISFLSGLLSHNDYITNNISTKYIDNNLENLLTHQKDQKQALNFIVPLASGLVASFEPDIQAKKTIWQQVGYWRNSSLMDIVIDGTTKKINLVRSVYPKVTFELDGEVNEAEIILKNQLNYVLKLNNNQYEVSIYQLKTGSFEIGHAGCYYQFIRPDISAVDEEVFTDQSSANTDPSNIVSPMPGRIIKVNISQGNTVKKGDVLLIVEAMKMENNIIAPVDGIIEEIKVKEGDRVDASMQLVKIIV